MAIKQLLHGLTHNGEGHARVLMTSICRKKKYRLPIRAIHTRGFARLGYVSFLPSPSFFSMKAHVRSLHVRHYFRFSFSLPVRPVCPIERYIVRFCDETPPATERYLYIDQTPSDDGRTAASSQQERTLSSYICRGGFRAKVARTTADGGN